MRQLCVVVGISLGLSGVASAQDRVLLTNQAQYQGVVPGTPNPPPRARLAKRETRTIVTWPGFQPGPQGGSRIFIQTSRAVAVQESRGPSRIVYRLRDCVISTRNNRNPLVTSQFDTPVTSAFLRRAGRDVELVITLRAEVEPAVTNAPGADGLEFVFIDFPAGNWLPNGPPPIAEPARMRRSSSSSPSSSEQEEPLAPSYLDPAVGPSP